MNRRYVLCWAAALIAFVVSAVAHYRGGMGGIDGVFLVTALLCVLLAIVTHEPMGRRG